MSLSLVTAVYALRKTRPLNYYLIPTQHLLEDLANSEISVYLFTNLDKSFYPSASNIKINNLTPNELICDIWDDPNWKIVYKNALSDRPENRFEEKIILDLIAIWLGKFKMMEIACDSNVDKVLWQDSGIRMGIYKKDFSKYKKCKTNPKIYIKKTQSILEKHPLAFMECDGFVNPYHGVDMKKYGLSKKYSRGGFILSKKNEVKKLKEKVSIYWKKLIANNDYGTEENPLTLYQWERKDSVLISYEKWISMLNIKHATKVIL